MARDDLHFRLRIPEDIKLKIEAAAKENRRSITAEIVARLETTLEMDAYVPGPNRHEDEEMQRLLSGSHSTRSAFGLMDEETFRKTIREEIAKLLEEKEGE